MPKPLAANEKFWILLRLSGVVQQRLEVLSNKHEAHDRYLALTPDQQQFVDDCVNDAVAEIDRVLAPVPTEEEIAGM